jgi:hypothetical protein
VCSVCSTFMWLYYTPMYAISNAIRFTSLQVRIPLQQLQEKMEAHKYTTGTDKELQHERQPPLAAACVLCLIRSLPSLALSLAQKQ